MSVPFIDLRRFEAGFLERWSSIYDVFPSLHIAVTLALLQQDLRHARRLLPIVLPVGIVTMISTVWLGYHYAVDLIAGVLLFVVAYWFLGRKESCSPVTQSPNESNWNE